MKTTSLIVEYFFNRNNILLNTYINVTVAFDENERKLFSDFLKQETVAYAKRKEKVDKFLGYRDENGVYHGENEKIWNTVYGNDGEDLTINRQDAEYIMKELLLNPDNQGLLQREIINYFSGHIKNNWDLGRRSALFTEEELKKRNQNTQTSTGETYY